MSVTGQSGSGYRTLDSSAVAEPSVGAERPGGAEPPGIAKPRTGHGWGVAMVRHRRLVVALWVLLLIASGALYPSLRRALGAPDYRVAGSQSTHVEQLLEKRFPNVGSEDDALVLYSRGHTASDRTYTQFIDSLLGVLAHRPGVKGVLSPFSTEAIGQISSDEHSAVAAVALTGTPQQRFENASRLQSVAIHAAAATHGAIQAWLTGYSPVTKDMVHVQTVDVERAEAIGVPVAFVVLLFALGSLVAAAIPLALAGAGLLLTYGVLALVIKVSHFDNFLISIVAMVGVGIGIDYALIIVSRFREEFARQRSQGGEDARALGGEDAQTPGGGDARTLGEEGTQTLGGEDARVADAVGIAISTAGRTILFSGVICALAITAMLVLRAAVFREITVGVVAVVACTLLAALTLLPAVLGMLGSRIDRGSLPARMQPADARADGGERMGGWARWALAVMAHPIVAMVASTAILLVSAAPALGLHYGLNLGVLTVSEAPSGKGEQMLARAFAPGAVSPMQIILTGPRDNGTSADANAARSLTETLERDSRVAGVSERSSSAGVLLSVVTSVAVDSNVANALMRHIRQDLAPPLHARWGVTVLAGGATGVMVDLAHETSTKFPLVLALILAVSLLFLLVVFRSPILAVKAILMNLLATAAMLGIIVYVFQEGHGEHLLAFTSTGFIQCFVPLTVFALVYGLSMDYEVFLIRRIQEEWKRTGDNRHSVAVGLEHTARPIAAAAAIMVVVFGSFVTANLLELKQLGFAVAVGIAIDATLIRLVLVPALMRLFGDWNWWLPAWLDRLLPKLEHE
jgi:putative drug exporter of the RND superfamily